MSNKTQTHQPLTFIKRILIISLGFCLNACMPPPTSIAPQNLQKSFTERKLELADLKRWNLKGGIAVKEGNKGFNASMLWQQFNPSSFKIQFSGPLGAGKVQLTKKDTIATLTDGNNTVSSNNAERLLKKHTGHYIPVNSLFYWIRGLPTPNIPSSFHKDTFGHLSQLNQLGWKINYLRFTHFKNFDIPAKLVLTKKNIRVKIIISKWG